MVFVVWKFDEMLEICVVVIFICKGWSIVYKLKIVLYSYIIVLSYNFLICYM